jgi:hypothetical protein
LRGVAGNLLTQGIGVATGLQAKFDRVGVAAAGVGGGVINAVGANAASIGLTHRGTVGQSAVAGMVRNDRQRATRTLISGIDFGDNIMAALPDTVGQRAGTNRAGAVWTSRAAWPQRRTGESPLPVWFGMIQTPRSCGATP